MTEEYQPNVGDEVTTSGDFGVQRYHGKVIKAASTHGRTRVEFESGDRAWIDRRYLQPKRKPMTHRVFVYGTLKRGYGNNVLLRGSTYIGPSVTVPRYRMLEPSFPVILPDENGKQLAGEVYHVDDTTLASLDRLEGVRPDGSGMYTREVIDVIEQDQPVQAYIYVGNPTHWTGCGNGRRYSSVPAYTKVNAAGALDWVR